MKLIIFNYCNFMVFITKMWLSVCHCAEAETVSSFRRLNKSSCFCHCATGKADVLVQEVWENKTAQQGQIVECLEFVVAASTTELSRVYLCVCVSVCVLHEYVRFCFQALRTWFCFQWPLVKCMMLSLLLWNFVILYLLGSLF